MEKTRKKGQKDFRGGKKRKSKRKGEAHLRRDTNRGGQGGPRDAQKSEKQEKSIEKLREKGDF